LRERTYTLPFSLIVKDFGSSRQLMRGGGRPRGKKVHASVSGFHSESSFGEDESIDKNIAIINNRATAALINI
jgi:hypothetical protein